MKVVYCLNSVRHLGGIEMVTIVKANALAEVEGNEVYLVVTEHHDGTEITPISHKVQLVGLDVNYYEDDWKSKWHVLKGIFIKRRLHKKLLRKVLCEIHPDVVVSVGLAEKYMLPSIRCKKDNWKTIREMHYVKNYRSLVASSFFEKVMAYCADFYDYHCAIKRYDKIVVLTEEDKERNWHVGDDVAVIPNPVTFKSNEVSLLNTKKIVAAGRLVSQKNFSSLISAFRLVLNEHPDWVLDIYGEGGKRKELQCLIDELQLNNNVYLRGYTSKVREKMIKASGFVMSSTFEGFGLVLIEAMSCGLPCISYACPCGPHDIITDGQDGFLIPVGDEKMLADKICYLIEHPDVKVEMGKAALHKAERYNIENIIPMWMELFRELLETKLYE